jgi:hypothetical protein
MSAMRSPVASRSPAEQRQATDVVAGRQLRHHAAVGRVEVDLGVQAMAAAALVGVVTAHPSRHRRFRYPERAWIRRKIGFYLPIDDKAKSGR